MEGNWNNYWRLRRYSQSKTGYAYVDARNHIANSLFDEEGIKVHFKKEMINGENSYCIIFCNVSMADAEAFQTVMNKLKSRMLLLGHNDYESVCREVDTLIRENLGGE